MNESDLNSSLKAGPKPVYAGITRRTMTPREALAGSSRLVPVVVVFGTVVGFMALAWYAYQAGSQSVTEDELLVVEADKGPMKEKPTDPGGMQFPNQDKTIFETFSGSNQKPPKVERVLPTPEEPIAKNLDTSETKTWINEKLHQHEGEAKTEQVIGDDSKEIVQAPKEEEKKAELAVDSVPVLALDASGDPDKAGKAKVIHIPQADLEAAKKADEERAKAKAEAEIKAKEEAEAKAKEAAEAKVKAQKAAAEADAKAAAEKAEADKASAAAKAQEAEAAKAKAVAEAKARAEEEAKLAAEKAAAAAKAKAEKAASEAKIKATPASTGSHNVQLGAYSSQEEAEGAWAKLQKKYKQLGNMKPVIVRADLGDKGVFYRLRTGGFSTAGEAKAFCNSMSILGQACLVPSK